MLTPLSILRIISNTKQKGEILYVPGAMERYNDWPQRRDVDSDIHNGWAVGSKGGHTLKILNAV